jgi:hypothetical protein
MIPDLFFFAVFISLPPCILFILLGYNGYLIFQAIRVVTGKPHLESQVMAKQE